MKKVVFILMLLMVALLAGCTAVNNLETHAAASQTDANKELPNAPQETVPSTVTQSANEEAESNSSSAFVVDDFTMEDFMVSFSEDYVAFDFDALMKTVGFTYVTSSSSIIVTPLKESAAMIPFEMNIYINNGGEIIGGSTTNFGSQENGKWSDSRSYDSATDFIFPMITKDKIFLIGADEMDFLYREVRILIAPAEEIDDVIRMVDEELASYYEE